MTSSNRATPATEDKIARLADLPRDKLIASWIKTHGHPPPKGIKRGLLERDYAWRLQARVNGGLKRATAKALIAIAQQQDTQSTASTKQIKSGSRLVRDWHGVTHQVDVTHMYGPAVRCKRNIKLAVLGRASMYQASDWSTFFAPGHHG